LLGICLGMQLLFDRSEEEDVPCLGIIPGKVRKLAAKPGMPVPHMGWSRLALRNGAGGATGLRDGDYVYFAHSFACDDGPDSVAVADYGRPIPAAVRRGNVWGAQFHPERSGEAGARFLAGFLAS
jgi:glutamine amidotransferase